MYRFHCEAEEGVEVGMDYLTDTPDITHPLIVAKVNHPASLAQAPHRPLAEEGVGDVNVLALRHPISPSPPPIFKVGVADETPAPTTLRRPQLRHLLNQLRVSVRHGEAPWEIGL
jgi:hypothetical protein